MIPSPSQWTSKSKTWAQARKANKELENAAIHRIILRAIEQGTLGQTSPYFQLTAADYTERFLTT